MATAEERLSRLEGAYDHLATKADIANVETQISGLRAEMHRINAANIKWGASFMAGALVVGLGAVTAIVRFLG